MEVGFLILPPNLRCTKVGFFLGQSPNGTGLEANVPENPGPVPLSENKILEVRKEFK